MSKYTFAEKKNPLWCNLIFLVETMVMQDCLYGQCCMGAQLLFILCHTFVLLLHVVTSRII